MTTVTIWHNPRCSKSRQTLALIEGKGIRPEVVEYLKTPPSREDVARVVQLLGVSPIDLMRKGETVYKELEIEVRPLGDDELIAAMAANPILIERPVVIANGKAALGRPPENVLGIL
ncbi:MAG: arsenate reductase (glutaredoxin) [Anderseniella sp.]|jgi:arsenate reductase (glutaredoxin)|nr:arsenate reductase (glutaredoxin) [Anderseniella sp.]